MSSTQTDGGPAFPAPDLGERDYGDGGAYPGMSLRDYLAGKALVGLLSEPYVPGSRSTAVVLTGRTSAGGEDAADCFAAAAYMLADAMLRARGRT